MDDNSDVEEFTDEELREQFLLVHRLKGQAKVLQVKQTQEPQLQHGLSFEIYQHDHPVKLAVLTDRQTLIDLARRILGTLHPVTIEEIQEGLRRLQEDQD